MPVFVIIPTSQAELVAGSLAARLPGNYYSLPHGEFLAAYAGTSKALSDYLGISEGTGGSAFIASLSGYHGRAPNEVWEWLKQHWS
jgi:hypothetical protein